MVVTALNEFKCTHAPQNMINKEKMQYFLEPKHNNTKHIACTCTSITHSRLCRNPTSTNSVLYCYAIENSCTQFAFLPSGCSKIMNFFHLNYDGYLLIFNFYTGLSSFLCLFFVFCFFGSIALSHCDVREFFCSLCTW